MSKKELGEVIEKFRAAYWDYIDNNEIREAKRTDTIIGKMIALYELQYGKYDK